jgi:hypothetical protein
LLAPSLCGVGARLVPIVVNLTLYLQACPDISREDFHALLNVLAKYYKNEIKTSEEVLEKVFILQ